MYLYIRLGPQGIRAVPAPPVSVQASLSSLDSSHGLAEQNLGFVIHQMPLRFIGLRCLVAPKKAITLCFEQSIKKKMTGI